MSQERTYGVPKRRTHITKKGAFGAMMASTVDSVTIVSGRLNLGVDWAATNVGHASKTTIIQKKSYSIVPNVNHA